MASPSAGILSLPEIPLARIAAALRPRDAARLASTCRALRRHRSLLLAKCGEGAKLSFYADLMLALRKVTAGDDEEGELVPTPDVVSLGRNRNLRLIPITLRDYGHPQLREWYLGPYPLPRLGPILRITQTRVTGIHARFEGHAYLDDTKSAWLFLSTTRHNPLDLDYGDVILRDGYVDDEDVWSCWTKIMKQEERTFHRVAARAPQLVPPLFALRQRAWGPPITKRSHLLGEGRVRWFQADACRPWREMQGRSDTHTFLLRGVPTIRT